MPGGERSPTRLRIGGDGERLFSTIVLHGRFAGASFLSMFISSSSSVKDDEICAGRAAPPAHSSFLSLLLVMLEWSLLFLARRPNVGGEYLRKNQTIIFRFVITGSLRPVQCRPCLRYIRIYILKIYLLLICVKSAPSFVDNQFGIVFEPFTRNVAGSKLFPS